MQVTLKTYSGHYLCAEDGGKPQHTMIGGRLGGLVVADRTLPGAWETFEVEVISPTEVALKSVDGFYMAVENDSHGTVVCNRTERGAWEAFTVIDLGNGQAALRAWTGKFLCAEGGGGGQLLANRPFADRLEEWAPGPWETFTASAALIPAAATADSPVPRLQGPLVLVRGGVGQVLADDSGDVLPVGVHDGSDFSDWVHGREAEVEARTKLERQAGYVTKRVFTIVGYYDRNRPGDSRQWNAWGDRECTPTPFIAHSGRRIEATPGYYDKKADYLQMLDRCGMTILDDRGDMVGMTPAQCIEHMRVNGMLFNRLGDLGKRVLAGLHAGNEWWQNAPGILENDDEAKRQLCRQMLDAFKAGAGWWPSVRGLSAPPDASENPEHMMDWGKSPATVMTVHGSRVNNSHLIAHYFNYGKDVRPLTGQVIISMEPVGDGLGVSVGRVSDPEVITAIAAACLVSGTMPVFMSGRGVWGELGADGPGGLDKHAGFWSVAKLPTYLPKDLWRFGTVQHSGDSQQHRFVEAGKTEGTPRFDFTLDRASGRFAGVLHATDWQPVKILKHCQDFTIRNLVTGEVERSGPINAGELMAHPYRRARLVTGIVG